jgi:hypothetical protein
VYGDTKQAFEVEMIRVSAQKAGVNKVFNDTVEIERPSFTN